MDAQQELKHRWSRRSVAAVVLGLLVALTALVAVAGSFQPACGLCHGDQSQTLAKTSHAETGCYGCHLASGAWSLPSQKASELLAMYPKAVVGAGYRGSVTLTSARQCLKCHSGVLAEKTEGKALRIQHSTCAKGSTCDTCHSGVAHPDATRGTGAPVMEDCIACHRREGGPVQCDACHVGDVKPSVVSRGPWQVIHGRDWKKTHGMGQVDSCATCHLPGFCSDCHKVPVPHPLEFGSTHGELAMRDPESCATCHMSKRFCDACHGIAMPHPADFLKRHATLARGTKDPSCLRCHAAVDCGNCHENHVHPGGTQGVPVPWTYTQGSAQ